MGQETDQDPGSARFRASQRTYYDQRAPDFGDAARPDRRIDGNPPRELIAALVDELAPTGDVLELGCGSGGITRELLRHARTVTAVDGSRQMLERNRREVGGRDVTYVHADIFEWRPDRQYDAVYFGFWLSHVPPDSFATFWALVRACLRPGGRVGFVDEDDRAAPNDEVRLVDGVPVATRTLHDGRRFDIVKVFWDPAALEARLRTLGWDIAVRRAGETVLYGSGT